MSVNEKYPTNYKDLFLGTFKQNQLSFVANRLLVFWASISRNMLPSLWTMRKLKPTSSPLQTHAEGQCEKNETRERWYIPRQPLSICKQTIPMTQTCSWTPGWVNTKEPSPSIGFVTAQWFSACVSKQGVEEVKQGKLERTEHFKSEWWWDCHGFCSYYIAQFYTHTSFPLQNQKGWPLENHFFVEVVPFYILHDMIGSIGWTFTFAEGFTLMFIRCT